MTYKSCKRQMERILKACIIGGTNDFKDTCHSIKGKTLLRIINNPEMLKFMDRHGVVISNNEITETVHDDNRMNSKYVLMAHVYNSNCISIIYAVMD